MYASPKYNGEPTAQALATGMATLGRYGDDYMVHASEGETIVPGEIFEANPRLKQDLFRQMTMMGIEDPNRYVVGNSLNSLNPTTGQPEFFFKKIWKAAKKVLKVAAPVIAPILGNMIMPGLGGIIASALTTKLMGGSWGDALKSGVMSYAGGALAQGLGGLGEGGSGFFSGMGEGLSAPFTAASNLFSSGAQNPLAQGILGPRGAGLAFSGLKGTDFAQQPVGAFPVYEGDARLGHLNIEPGPQDLISRATPGAYNMTTPQFDPLSIYQKPAFELTDPSTWSPELKGDETFWSAKHATESGVPYNTALKPGPYGKGVVVDTSTGTIMNTGPKPSVPWYASKEVLGSAAAAAIPAGLAYALTDDPDDPEDEVKKLSSTDPRRIAYDKWVLLDDKNSPEALALRDTWYGKPKYDLADLQSKFGAAQLGAPRGIAAARGGEVVGRGTGTSDSIPARLSDGEFVMTADAVRNAGNGDRNLGAARMYDMMSRFERTG